VGTYDRDYMRPEGPRPQIRFGPGQTPRVIKVLILVNVAIYLLQLVWSRFDVAPSMRMEWLFGISSTGLVESWRLWQPVTYMFLHSPLSDPYGPGIMHILFNMLILWMFGSDVARRLGPRTFLGLYFGAGILAGLAYTAFAVLGNVVVPCIGASGAVMGVVVYAGMLFPDRTVLFMLFFPMRYRTMVWLLVGIDVFYFVFATHSGTAHVAHLGGALFGYLHFRYAHVLDRYFAQMEVKAERDRERQESEMREEVDRLLEKIHQEGLGSLSEREKKFLKRSSRRFEKKT
jgi:membrane associated rhomboid family serine protease